MITNDPFTRDTATNGAHEPITDRPKAPLLPLRNLLGELEADATAANEARRTGRLRGPITGFPHLDLALGGAMQPGRHVIHGGPGVGKTALALQIGASCGFPCLYVTVEMSALELFRRVIARTTETYLGRLKSGELPPDKVMDLARQAVAAVPNLTLMDATRERADPAWIIEAAESVRGDSPHLLLIVDSAHSWVEAMRGDAGEYEALSTGLDALKRMGARLNCPILLIAERNRAGMFRGGLHAAAGHRGFEYGAESLISLDKALLNEDEVGKGKAKPQYITSGSGEQQLAVHLEKNRNGATGPQTPLWFHGALQRFGEEPRK